MLVAVTLALRWVLGWLVAGRVRLLPDDAHEDTAGAAPQRTPAPAAACISVIIPARNEALLLPRLLASLARQHLAPLETIVVDDASDDRTAALAREAGATVVNSPGPPPGWTGKTYACHLGAQAARGELLVFLDADTQLAPDLLARLWATHQRRGGIVTVQPYHRMERADERASAVFNLVALAGIGARRWFGPLRVSGAFGPCLAIGRDDYDRIGGHTEVRNSVLEDVALGRLAAEHGVAVHAFEGRGTIEYRMYPGGLRALMAGWAKNFAGGARTTPSLRLLAIVAWISGLVEAGIRTLAPLVNLAEPSPIHAVFYVLFAAQLAVMLRSTGNFGLTAVVFPLAVAVFLAVFVRSLWWSARGKARWKDRLVVTRGAGP